MLKIVKNPEFTSKVKVQVPVEGGTQEQSFTARFRALSVSEGEVFNMLSTEGNTDFLRAILIGWDGVKDEDGEAISFNDASRDQILDIPFVRVAILQTYNQAVMGARRGN